MAVSGQIVAQEQASLPEGVAPVTAVEGIAEFKLDNGAQVLLFPDPSKSKVTVNMTVFVGSRHEGYGEAGMAHLLEHMLFKGTPGNQQIPQSLKNRGAQFNGTTWLDRTNYFETLPATSPEQASENLEFAIRLEADRLVNSFIRGEDLASEMTVVRSEFERGENSPQRVLMQRIQSIAYDWHNYGQSTIGNRSDIERVPIDRLQAFYRKFYRPDNIMLVVAGKFDPREALEYVSKYFGALERPATPLDRTYTTEPPQDGERSVVLRRVGNSQLVASLYHTPSGANEEYAAIEMLNYIFNAEPSGRLYQQLVVPELASSVASMSMALHDPGTIMFMAEVPTEKSLEAAETVLIETVESVGANPITADELERAKRQFTKDRELRATKTQSIAVELSEWAAQGDWRLYFLFRDFVEQVTPEDCTQAAEKYLTRNNRTVGLFMPTEESQSVEIPAKPDLDELLADYKGRGEIEQGEAFDPSPLAIKARTTRGELQCGLKTAWLPKKTRGGTVNISINLRYGNEQSLFPYQAAIEFLPEMMMRGTESMDYTQLQDRLDELRATVRTSGTNGLLSLSVETKREFLEELLPVLGEILRKPRLDAAELEVLRRQRITETEAAMTEPTALASIEVARQLAPYDKDNIRYVPTLEERVEQARKVSVDDIRQLHKEQLSALHGEVAAVGDFDPETLATAFDGLFQGWKTDVEFERIPVPASTSVEGGMEEILTPGKANAVYYASEHIAMQDDHPDYPALVIGNYVMGASALSSRLGNRVRQQEGLSYSVGSGLNAHPIDKRAVLTLYAICNPENKDKLLEVIREEIQLLLEEGISEDELAAAKQGILQSSQLTRTQDSALASILGSTIFAGRDMGYYADFEDSVANLTKEQVDSALRSYIAPDRLVARFAGDFRASE